MTVDELKGKLASERSHAAESKGRMVSWSENGPASLGMVAALVEVVERQQAELDELRKALASRS